MSTYLVTGANGFVGTALCRRLSAEGHHIVAVVRKDAEKVAEATIVDAATDFDGLAERWPMSIRCDVAIHLASRVHVMRESSKDVFAVYRHTNVIGSLRVAEAAVRAGAKRLVFVSSIKAMGDVEPGIPAHPWSEADTPDPRDPYGRSKLEAEQALDAFCRAAGLELVVVRPPLVYGPGVRANFLQLMSIIARRVPLPLARISARRSIIFIDNLIDSIIASATRPEAAGRCFNVSDENDLSVADLARILGDAMGCPARLLPVAPSVLQWVARVTGKTEQANRLLSPLRLDSSAIRETLDWRPPVPVEAGLRITAIWYRDAFVINRN